MQSGKLKIFHTIFLIAATFVAHGQSASGGDFTQNAGKIYGIVACIVVIFVVLALFLFRMDRKLTKLEKQLKNEQ